MGIAEKLAGAKKTNWVSEGFSEAEVKHLLEFCMCNASLLLTEDA